MASMKKVAWPGVMRWALALACTCAAAPSVATPGPGLQVLHWWTSTGERKAADLLAARLADEGIAWQDAAIPGGAGLGADKVLKGRVLAGDAPEVTQLIGPWIAERGVKVCRRRCCPMPTASRSVPVSRQMYIGKRRGAVPWLRTPPAR